jgi:dihydroxyacetone kinase
VAELPQFAAVDRGASEVVVQAVSVGSLESQRAAVTMREVLATMLRTVLDNEDELGRIDAVAGDGDHGVGMVRGLRAANSAADALDLKTGVSGVLGAAGAAWADKAGGSSGVLWGAILTAIGNELGDTEAPNRYDVARSIAAGADALHRLGKCEIGDKTMYDALKPFADALTDNVAGGIKLLPAWLAAAEVANTRASDTAGLVPLLGRARPLAERSVGTPDAGATSMALIITAVGETLSVAIRSADAANALTSR